MSQVCNHNIVSLGKDGRHRCMDCKDEFSPNPKIDLSDIFDKPMGKLQIMEPMPTLRDQLAMTAMIADLIQSAVISASYIANGQVLKNDKDYPTIESHAEEYYKTADAVLKVRNK